MELSKLEIKGFKSFGDKVVINFDQGITGIVGPNGCGKSNVIDSMRWVLGEQKQKNLRSDKMENVIFNGTKNRNAAQMAEVSLTLNNTKNLLPTEYSQVTITRKYYRSGESEYMLNGVACRLKDITNLFLDTGIGSDSYAIIELRMVDDILNDKNNSRRTLFEEASGISKFKIRKKQTIKKLDDTDKDLERVEDLLFEIEKNLRALERQAKVAKKYFDIKEEYKALSVDLAKISVKSENDSLNILKKQIENEESGRVELNAKSKELDAQIEKGKADLLLREKELSGQQKALNEHVANIRKMESEKKVKNERHRFLNDKKDSLNEHLEHDRKSRERAQFSLDSLSKDKEGVDKELSGFVEKVEALKKEYEEQREEVQILQENLNQSNDIFKESQAEFFQLKKDIEIKEVQLESFSKELEKLNEDSSGHNESLSEFEKKTTEIEEVYVKKKADFEKLKEREEETKTQVKELKVEIEKRREEVTKINRTLDAKENEYNLTKSLVDNLEGFPEAIKFLKKHDRWYKDAPLLTDVIACDEEYRTCIENYLEQYLNYFIVDDTEHAFQAIQLLNDATKGRANFFVLSKFEDKKYNATSEVGVAATEILHVEDKYRKLTENLLQNVRIVEDDFINYSDEEGVTIVTKNGKVISRDNSISGGSIGLFEGKKIGRAKNLDILKKDIRELSKELTVGKNKVVSLNKKVEKFQTQLNSERMLESQEEINGLHEQFVTYKAKKEQFASLLDSSTDRKESLTSNIKRLTEELQISKPTIEEKGTALKVVENEITELNQKLLIKSEMLTENSNMYNKENLVLHQKQNKLAGIDQELKFKNDLISSSSERIEKNISELKMIEEEIKKMIVSDEDDDGVILSKYEEKEAIEKALGEVEREYYKARGIITELEDAVKLFSRKKESSDGFVMELKTKENELKVNLISIKERLSVEFEIDIDKIIDEPLSSELAKEEIEKKVGGIKEKLDKIGPINPMAMEAYQEIQDRHTFITEQKKDLEEAKASLLETITEIDKTARDQFTVAFEEIRENFIKVFRTLFTEEDSCDLKLSDPNNPLDSEIAITAKPKGKRPLSINQLSGGEKTLTAISLLFAIYLIKPAPFCIFDEVDAPLDDANIDKFNNIIREFSNESQFIIVTHNKRTMASTDIIYGVTMPEIGISRVIPVDLRTLDAVAGE